MDSYQDFAWVYDELMDNVPYEQWTADIIEILGAYDINDGLVLDLGCGTGTVTRLLSKKGYDMIGIDLSEDMLSVAREKSEEEPGILYLCQDMREFELYGTVRAVVSLCDSINYLLSEDEVVETFKLVNNYLDPEGIFIFDFNTVYKYKEIIGDSVIAENRDSCSFIWENSFDCEENINEYYLTLFIEEEDGRYTRSEETHYQKGYELEQIKRMLSLSGLVFIRAYDSETKKEVNKTSERICVIAKESGKNAD